jgi:hypothetical protein
MNRLFPTTLTAARITCAAWSVLPAVLPAAEQGADVKGFLRHQQLLDEATDFYLTEFQVLVVDGAPQITPQLDAQSAPYLARIIAAQVACPLDGYSFFKKQLEMPPALSLAFLPFVLLADEEGGGMSAHLFDADVRPEVSCCWASAGASRQGASITCARVLLQRRYSRWPKSCTAAN